MGRKYYSELIVGTEHIMKQLLVEVEGVITHSVQAILCEAQTVLSSLTDVPNKQSPSENPLQ